MGRTTLGASILAAVRMLWLAVFRRLDTRAFYDAISRHYDLLARGQPAAARALLALRSYMTTVGEHPGSVLETECGTGLLSQHLLGLAPDLHGVDFSREQLARARAKGLPIHFARADVLSLPYPADHVDLVLSPQLLPHLADREGQYCREAYRVLKPGGLLVLDFTNPRRAGSGPARPGLGERARSALVALIRIDAWSLTPSDDYLLNVMQGAGFAPESVRSVDGGVRLLLGRKPVWSKPVCADQP